MLKEIMAKINPIFCILPLLVLLISGAQAGSWRESDNHRFRVFLGSYDEERLYGGFAFELKGNWKTYWKNAGDAGLPLKLRKASSDVMIHWPSPRRFFYQDGLYSYVYDKQVVIPFSFPHPNSGKGVKLRIIGEYSVCDVLCVPYTFDETLEIPVAARRADEDQSIRHALGEMPKNVAQDDALDVVLAADRNIINVSFRAQQLGAVRDVMIDGGDLSLRAPKIIADGDKVSALFDYQAFSKKQTRSPLENITQEIKTILVQTDRGTFQIFGAAPTTITPAAPEMMLWSFILILASAFLGGLILNIMPCVLPVISLKLAQMTLPAASLSLRAQLGWTVFGILLSFVLLAAIVYVLQQAGEIVGWGFHFQQPVFVLLMMSVLLFFAFAQLGFLRLGFASSVQGGINQWLDRFQPDRPAFHIFYGGVIALLATPCTAPFLGSAVGFALTQSFAVILLVFVSIGLGLAVPLLILLAWPGWANDGSGHGLRASRWTVYVRNFAAILLYGSALWLLWVSSGQLGLGWALGFFVTLHAALLILALADRRAARYAAAGIIFAVVVSPLALPSSPIVARVVEDDGLVWHIFSEAEFKTQRQKGKIVFIDISADWCLSCQYNKANVLLDDEVRTALGSADVYLMSGDLTKVNDKITSFIRKEGRGGIPFNGFYGRARKEILSEILSKKALLKSLEAIRANNY